MTDQHGTSMTNIPTDLLRTLVAVVDLRSFTKAAHSLGVTQPAVSAQIKRLQFLLRADLLDKSAPGVTLTPTGELVVSYARKLLSLNDQILFLAAPGATAQTLRLGLPEDFIAPSLAWTLSRFRGAWPQVRYHMRSAGSEGLLRELQQGELDIVVALTTGGPRADARHSWNEDLAWMRGASLRIDPARPVPFVSYGEESVYHRVGVGALTQAGRGTDLVFTGSNLTAITAAVGAGFGVTVLARNRFSGTELSAWDDASLPTLPAAYCGVYLCDRGDREALEQLADALSVVLRPAHEGPADTAAQAPPASAAGSAGY
jgi:DNA-binding transcriptional LysR family regulator